MGQLDAVAIGEVLEVVGQLLGARHLHPANQHGDHRDVASQGRGRFQANEISRVVQPSQSRVILGVDPVVADDRQQDAISGDRLVDRLAKIATGFDGGHIHEYGVAAEVAGEIVVQAAGFTFLVVSPVADEKRAHLRRPFAVSALAQYFAPDWSLEQRSDVRFL